MGARHSSMHKGQRRGSDTGFCTTVDRAPIRETHLTITDRRLRYLHRELETSGVDGATDLVWGQETLWMPRCSRRL